MHCAEGDTTCGEHCMHSVHANRAYFVCIHTYDNAQHTLTRVTSQNNTTALMMAAADNASDVAKLLIDEGSDVDAKNQVCVLWR